MSFNDKRSDDTTIPDFSDDLSPQIPHTPFQSRLFPHHGRWKPFNASSMWSTPSSLSGDVSAASSDFVGSSLEKLLNLTLDDDLVDFGPSSYSPSISSHPHLPSKPLTSPSSSETKISSFTSSPKSDTFPKKPLETFKPEESKLLSPNAIITEQVVFPFDPILLKAGLVPSEICAAIMEETETSMELSMSKFSKRMTILVKGKIDNVELAKKAITTRLCNLNVSQIKIPKERRKIVVGPSGRTIQHLMQISNCKIIMSKLDDKSPNDIVTIIGDDEGIKIVTDELGRFSDEPGDKVTEVISVPKSYHPFIYGYQHKIINEIMDKTKTKIRFSGAMDSPEHISVYGDRLNVMDAIQLIEAIVKEKQLSTSVVTLDVKKCLHKTLLGHRGSTLLDILNVTGCALELPNPLDPSESIAVRGPPDALVKALGYIMDKANSIHVESYPLSDLQFKFLSLRERPKLKAIEAKYAKGSWDNSSNHSDSTFFEDEFSIHLTPTMLCLQGPQELLQQAAPEVQSLLSYLDNCFFEHVTLPSVFHKHIIGRKGQTIAKFHQDYGVDIIVPNESDIDKDILIVGQDLDSLLKVKEELNSICHSLKGSSDTTFTLNRPEALFVLGPKGKHLKVLADTFLSLTFRVISQHDIESADLSRLFSYNQLILSIKGPTQHVREAELQIRDALAQVHTLCEEATHHETLRVDAQEFNLLHHRFDMLLDDTHVYLESLDHYDNQDLVLNLQASSPSAIETLKRQMLYLASPFTRILSIPKKYHSSLIGKHGKHIKTFMSRYDVVIQFSSNMKYNQTGTEDEAEIRGFSQAAVDEAARALMNLYQAEKDNAYTLHFPIQASLLPFVVGKGGIVVSSLRASTNTRIDILTQDNEHVVWIEGSRENVLEARDEIQKIIDQVSNQVVDTIIIPPHLHKLLIGHKGSNIKALTEHVHNTVRISFPPITDSTSNESLVTLRGPAEDVALMKSLLQANIEELLHRVYESSTFPKSFLHFFTGPFARSFSELHQVELSVKQTESCVVQFSGTEANVQEALQAMNRLLETAILLDSCQESTRHLLLDKAEIHHKILKQSYNAYLIGSYTTPMIYLVSFASERLAAAHLYIQSIMDSFLDHIVVRLAIPKSYHRFIVGKRGHTLQSLMSVTNTEIQVPSSTDYSSTSNEIKIIGNPNNVQIAKEKVLALVDDVSHSYSHETPF